MAITTICEIVKNTEGSGINIDSYDEGLTENELTSLKRRLKDVAIIKKAN
jgi:hypothetical protein